ncbi:MAG: hypothetical protein WCI73_16350, partial [Phycisphaerae bacterium]
RLGLWRLAMKVKNINPLEQHVEKITLAVAAAAAAYLIYAALSPVMVEKTPGNPLDAEHVEQQVGQAVKRLQE